MLLSIDHPELLPHLKTVSYGLQPIYYRKENRYALVLKVTKEMILTARVRGEFKVYLLGDGAGPGSHLGFITAFFDDPDEPLTIRSPQFAGDELLEDLTALLSQPEFDVYCFDEHDRELMGVRAHNADAARFSAEMQKASFGPYAWDDLPQIIQRLDHRFSARNVEDDAKAFTISLGERLYPDNITFIDGREELYQFQGAQKSIAATSLERDKPGPPQERDIAVMLGRVFDGNCIYLNPMRDDTGRELTDILIVTDTLLLFIQAKDSPNTEATLRRTMDRKRAAVRAHVEKAANQLRGALSYAATAGDLLIRTLDGPAAVPVGNRQMIGLVVVREMFDGDYDACSVPVFEVMRAVRIPAVLLDYSGLHIMAQNLRTPTKFVNGLADLFEAAMKNQRFPKPVWLGPPRED